MTTPQNNDPNYDPLASAIKRPAVSWKDVPVNQVKSLKVESFSREAQTTVFGSNPPALAYWENKDGTKAPKMAVVFDVEEDGEQKSLWLPKPGSGLTAVAQAQTDAGQRIGPGGTLEIYISAKKPSGKGNDQNLFKAKYTPPAAGANTPDPLSAPASAPAAQPAASDPWSTTPATDEPPF
jgi:hypothetical protein